MSLNAGVDIAPVAAPLILGYFFMYGLYGVLSSQIYIYHMSFPGDKWIIKSMVYGIYLLATLQVTLTLYDAIITLGFGFGNLGALSNGALSYIAVPILTGTIALIVQMFYAFRIYVLTKSRIWPLIVAILSLMQCSSAYVCGIFEVFIGDVSKIPQFRRMTFTEGGWVITSGVCDIIIAICMCRQLFGYSENGIMSRTQSMVVSIMKIIIGSGAMTATIAVIVAVLSSALPHSVAFNAPSSMLANLYANSMLVILNNRLRFKSAEWVHKSFTEDMQLGSLSTMSNPRTKDTENTKATIISEQTY